MTLFFWDELRVLLKKNSICWLGMLEAGLRVIIAGFVLVLSNQLITSSGPA